MALILLLLLADSAFRDNEYIIYIIHILKFHFLIFVKKKRCLFGMRRVLNLKPKDLSRRYQHILALCVIVHKDNIEATIFRNFKLSFLFTLHRLVLVKKNLCDVNTSRKP